MDTSTLTVLDFETEAIDGNVSVNAPKPVGLAIRWPNGSCEYLAWGHPQGNNCTEEEARRAYLSASQGPVVFHNGKFDMEVARQHWNIPWPAHYHDTLFCLFLHDPDAPNFQLKDSALRYLNQQPEEQDRLAEWIIANCRGANRKNFGAFISKAPVALVEPYAIGDVRRTFDLFKYLYPVISALQKEPYDREIRLLPYLVQAEKRGIRVDRELLLSWESVLSPTLARCDELIRLRLNAPNLNVDSNDELAAVMEREGLFAPTPFSSTDGLSVHQPSPFTAAAGSVAIATNTAAVAKRSMAKAALRAYCTDVDLVELIIYRNSCATLVRTFIIPWIALSSADGRLHTTWHQVRGTDANGTRTGRVASADPNLTNTPNPVDIKPPFGLPFLPSMRQALLPEEGEVWVSADYSQQELRILAHYEDGNMMAMYKHDPHVDLHSVASRLIKDQLGLDVPRKHTKNVAFASIYGAGNDKLADMLHCSPEEAFGIKEAYFAVLPGVRSFISRVKAKARGAGCVRSLGGRVLPLEKPKLIKGQMRSFDYKMPNKLIQGSAADQTKEAIAWFCERGGAELFRAQCYDEINLSVRPERLSWACDLLVDSMMNAIPLDVSMVVDVETGPNHAQTTPWKPVESLSVGS